jgi:glycosyltransferase involved in cell wall biosynthesis
MTPLLSICIPTYNRIETLKSNVQLLLPCLSPTVELIISDNGSSDQTSNYLTGLIQTQLYLKIILGKYNLGCDVNYLRLLENSSGEWCWYIGDDDPIDVAYIPELLKRLQNETTDVVHLAPPEFSSCVRDDTYHKDTLDFCRNFYRMASFYFLPTTIIRRIPAQSLLKKAYTSCGLLHSYVSLSYPLIANHGLRIYNFGILDKPKNPEPLRWPRIGANFLAWQTQYLIAQGSELRALNLRHAHERTRNIFFSSLYDILGLIDGDFEPAHLTQMRKMLLIRHQPLTAITTLCWLLSFWPEFLAFVTAAILVTLQKKNIMEKFLKKQDGHNLYKAILIGIQRSRMRRRRTNESSY